MWTGYCKEVLYNLNYTHCFKFYCKTFYYLEKVFISNFSIAFDNPFILCNFSAFIKFWKFILRLSELLLRIKWLFELPKNSFKLYNVS